VAVDSPAQPLQIDSYDLFAISFWLQSPSSSPIDDRPAPVQPAFMFRGASSLPLMLLYTFISYRVFRESRIVPEHY
jgi:hypothetical protein